MKKNAFSPQWLILGLALIIFVGAVGFNLYLDRARTQSREQERLLAQTHVAEANVAQSLIAINEVLVELRKQLRQDALDPNLNRHLRTLASAMSGVRTLAIYDAAGKVVASNQPVLLGKNFSQRPYFKAPQQHPDMDMLYISPPFRSVLGGFVITVSVSMAGTRGEFSGIIAATLDPEYFATLLESVRYASDMRTRLIHWDGDVFMERPSNDDTSGNTPAEPGAFLARHKDSGQSQNIFTSIAVPAGDRRMIAFQTVASSQLKLDKPLVVTASRDPGEIYAVWRKDLITDGTTSGLIVLASILALHAFQRRQRESSRQLDEATEALHATHALIKESEEKHRAIIETTDTGYVILNGNGQVNDANGEYVRLSGHSRLADTPHLNVTRQTRCPIYPPSGRIHRMKKISTLVCEMPERSASSRPDAEQCRPAT